MSTPRMQSAINEALSHAESSDIIEGVKTAVARELEALDPLVEVRTTDYFNHSFVPDLIVRWKERGDAEERGVYLRYTMRAAALGGDVHALADFGPMIVTLRDEDDQEVKEDLRRDVADTKRVLVTDGPTLDIASNDAEHTDTSPLISLVRGNLVRGARGLLDRDKVAELRQFALRAQVGGNEAYPGVLEFGEAVSEVFVEEAAFRLRRAASLVHAGLSEQPEVLLESVAEGNALSGELSDTELRVLLPYLLSRRDVTMSPEYWSLIGSMTSLDRIEAMSAQLEGLNLTPLVFPNLEQWQATKASLTAHEFDEEDKDDPFARARGWQIHARMLSLAVGSWRLHVTSDGRKIRGRNDSLMAAWDDLQDAFRIFPLERISLRGITRTVDIAAKNDSDLRADVEVIKNSLEDRFFVPNASVRYLGRTDSAVDADFTRMVASAPAGASVAALSSVALDVLGYRYPTPRDEKLGYLPWD